LTRMKFRIEKCAILLQRGSNEDDHRKRSEVNVDLGGRRLRIPTNLLP